MALLTVAGCGGGGDGSDAGATSSNSAALSAGVQSGASVPPASYAAGSDAAQAFARFNIERAHCGFGALTQNARLDQAAQAHLAYLQSNSVGLSHFEDPAHLAYTGVTVGNRVSAAGYDWRAVSEIMASIRPGSGERTARSLLGAPYHAIAGLAGYREVGLAWDAVAGVPTLVADLGLARDATPQGGAEVVTYPCEGTSGVQASISNETPAPFPGEANAAWGQPIMVRGAASLRITAASITGPDGSVSIKGFYADGQTADPHGECADGWACVIPVALQTNTRYAVQLRGSNDGTAFERNFSFSTGSR